MRILTYIVILVAVLTTVSCDRFKHAFEPVVSTDFQAMFFTPLDTSLDSISAVNVLPVSRYYADDYLHNGIRKADREQFYSGLFTQYGDTLSFEVILLQNSALSDTLTVLNWRLKVFDASSQVVVDSVFFGERLIQRGKGWQFYGNQSECCIPTIKQRVFIEYFTFVNCPNCPPVEALLHQLQIDYPNNLTYLEYHYNDPLDCGNSDIYTYYGTPSFPSVIFQGETRILGNNPDNEAVFNQLATEISQTNAEIELSDLDYTINGQILSGTIKITLKNQSIPHTDLKLRYALIDKERTFGQFTYRNVVLAKNLKSLHESDLSQPVAFNLTFNGNLPLDTNLVLWVQKMPATFENNAKIYHGLETQVIVNKCRKK